MCGIDMLHKNDIADIVKQCLPLNEDEKQESPYRITINGHDFSTHVEVMIHKHNDYVGKFCLEELPGNATVAVSHGMYITDKFRGQGFATALQEAKKRIAHSSGVLTLMCTTNSANEIENQILMKHGWNQVGRVKNYTHDHTFIWTKEVERG